MFISVHELRIHRTEYEEKFGPGVIDLGPEIRQLAPLDTSGRAELLEEHRGGREGTVADIRLVGGLTTQIELACARCLDPVQNQVERKFDLLYRPLGEDRRADEAAIHEADTEIGYYAGEGLLLEDVLREQVLLAVPIRLLCQDGCKGLCPQCGRDLNRETCNCAAPANSERWAALKEIKDRLP